MSLTASTSQKRVYSPRTSNNHIHQSNPALPTPPLTFSRIVRVISRRRLSIIDYQTRSVAVPANPECASVQFRTARLTNTQMRSGAAPCVLATLSFILAGRYPLFWVSPMVRYWYSIRQENADLFRVLMFSLRRLEVRSEYPSWRAVFAILGYYYSVSVAVP